MNLLAISTLLISFTCLHLGFFFFYKSPKSFLNRYFALLAIILFYWKFCDFMCLQSANPDIANLWIKIVSARHFVVSVFFICILSYTENMTLVKNRPLQIIIHLPALILAILNITTDDLVTVLNPRNKWGYTYDYIPHNALARNLFFIWLILILLIGILLIARYFFTKVDRKIIMGSRFIAIALLIPLFGFAVENLIVPHSDLQGLTSNIYIAWIMIFISYSIWKYRSFHVSPESAADKIVATMNDGLLILDPRGWTLYANPAFFKLMGFSKKDIIGENIRTFGKMSNWDDQFINDILNGREFNSQIFSFQNKNHDTISGNFSNSFLCDDTDNRVGIVCIINDITDIKRAQSKLQKQYDWLEVILASIGDAVIATDPEENIIFINTAAAKLTGWKNEEALGRKIADVYRIFDKNAERIIEPPIRQILQKKAASYSSNSIVLISKDDRRLEITGSGAPITNPAGDIHGVVLVFRDISEHKKTEKRIRKTQDRLIHSEKLAGIGHLAAGVAHEINNPMGFIMNNLIMLKKYSNNIFSIFDELGQDLKPKIKSVFEDLKEEENFEHIREDLPKLLLETIEGSKRVKTIVANLKDFAHPVQEEFSQIDLNLEVEKSLTLVWNELKYHCEVEKKFGSIPKIMCNRGQIGQIIVNLLVNAAQAIEDKMGKITIKTAQEGPDVLMVFSDTGTGIPDEIINKIFDPFFTTKELGKGTGLGLSLVKEIIENHGWMIDVKSKPGQGTTFTIKIPSQYQI